MGGFVVWFRRRAFTLAALCWMAVSAGAAEINMHPHSTAARPIISVSGQFYEGDDKVFASLAAPLDQAEVVFSSPGGNLMAGIGIGKIIRIKGFGTHIGNSEVCASACGLAWLGGVNRTAHEGAQIGFHAAYVTEGNESREHGAANDVVGAYLAQLGMSQSSIVYITSAPPEGMQWLPVRQARSFGLSWKLWLGQSQRVVPKVHRPLPTTSAVR